MIGTRLPFENSAAQRPRSAVVTRRGLRSLPAVLCGVAMLLALGADSSRAEEWTPPPLTVEVLAAPPRMDGDLEEWAPDDLPRWARVDSAEQALPDRPNTWDGPDDLSAIFRLGLDHEALYLAMRVRDDRAFHPGQPWWHGDSVELFLDLSPAADAGEPGTSYREGCWQIFLMPRNPELAWGVAYRGPQHHFDDAGLRGVEVAHHDHAGDAGYDMEVRLPLANLGLDTRAARRIGFALAINDADEGPADPGTYLSWNRAFELYRRPDRFTPVRLPAVAAPPAGSVGGGGEWLWIAVIALVAVLSVLLIAGPGSRIAARLGPTPKVVGLALTGLLAIVYAVDGARATARAEQRVARELETLAEEAQAVAAEAAAIGALPAAGPGQRMALVEQLLKGERVSCVLPPARAELLPLVGAATCTARARRGYHLPLESGLDLEPFDPAAGTAVTLHLEVEARRSRDGQGAAAVPVALLTVVTEEAGQALPIPVEADPGREGVQSVRVPLGEPGRPTRLRLQPVAGAPRTTLVGVNVVSDGKATPLVLAGHTDDGIPILGGPGTPSLERRVLGGQSTTLDLPYLLGADRLWVVLTAPGAFPETLGDDAVCRIEVSYDRGDPGVLVATSGQHVTSEVLPMGIQRPPGMLSRVAYRWTDVRGLTHAHDAIAVRIDPERRATKVEIAVPPEMAEVRLVAATLVRSGTPPPSSRIGLAPGGPAGSDEIFLRAPLPAFVHRLGMRPENAVRLERAVVADQAPAVLALSAPLPPRVAAKRHRTQVALLTCLAIALVLLAFLAADAVERFHRLTIRLASAVLLAALLPLGATIWLVDRTTSDRLEAEHTARARATLATVETALKDAQRRTRDDASSLARHLVSEPGEIAPDRIARLLRLYRGGALPTGAASLALVTAADRPMLLVPPDPPGARLLGARWLAERSSTSGMQVSPWDGLLLVGGARYGSEEGGVGVALGVRVDAAFLTAELAGALPEAEAAVALLDADGRPLAAAGPGGDDFAQAVADHGADVADDASGVIRRVPPHGAGGRPRLAVRARLPVASDTAEAPWLVVGLDRTSIEEALTDQRERLAWVALFGLVLVVGVASLTARRVADPVKDLVRVTEAVRRGEFDTEVPPAGSDEVGDLTIAFDQMRVDLKHRVADLDLLRRAQDDLSLSLDYAERAGRVVELLRTCFHADAVILLDATSAEGPLAIAAEHGRRTTFADRRFRGAPAGWLVAALQGDGPLEITTPGEDERVAAEGPVGGRLVEQRPAWLAMPLKAGGETVGLAVMAYDEPERLPRGAARRLLVPLAGVSALALHNARLYRLAALDQVSGLPGATAFAAALRTDVERAASGGPHVLLLRVGLDHLEHVTMRRGVEPARDLVRALAAALRDVVGDLARLGRPREDELAVRLPGATRLEALALAERIRERLGRVEIAPEDGSEPVATTVTVGVAAGPEDGTSLEFLLDAAGRALAAARREGGDRVEDAARLDAGLVDLPPYEEGTIVRSEKMVRIVEAARRAARTDTSVLITGETGTGKEVIANLIHRRSVRADRPFVKVNCAAFPETLLESELFGHERGAFTGAERRREGRFELADGGTLFLDEIAEMSLGAQVKLLRVLQERQFTRLGGTRTVKVDVRIIAATNQALEAAVEDGAFREDLYYRLNVIRLEIPPLRERREEIPLFVESFLREAVRRAGRGPQGLNSAAMDVLYRHPWPGNVRELKNVLERCAVLCDADEVGAEHLRLDGARGNGAANPRSAPRDELNERQKQLLDHLARHGRCTNREYYEMTGTSPRTGLRDLQDLIARGLLLREGKRRGAVYRLP